MKKINSINWEELKRLNSKYFKNLKRELINLEDTAQYTLGPNVQKLEKEIAKYIGVKYCVAVGNGLDALTISLKSLNLESGSEVIVPSNTFYASVLAIIRANLVPVLCEPNLDTYNIEVSNIKKLITNKTKAILPVHLYGRPCQMEEICKLANEYNLKIVEDCAQAFGAEYHRQKVGSFGDLAAFSFYPTKNLGGIGDSGMIATNDINLYNYCKLARSYGGDKYHYDVEGINSRMDEIQALFLLNKLNDIEKNNNKKIRNAKLYFKYLKNKSLILPSQPEINSKNVFHIFCVRTRNRDKLKQYLEDNNIQSIIHYPIPIFKQKALKHVVNNVYPISEEISETVLSIPCSMAHTKDEIMRVIKVLNEYKE